MHEFLESLDLSEYEGQLATQADAEPASSAEAVTAAPPPPKPALGPGSHLKANRLCQAVS